MGVRGISGDGHRASRSEIPIANSPIAVRDRILLLSGPCSHVHDLGTRGTAGIDRAGLLRAWWTRLFRRLRSMGAAVLPTAYDHSGCSLSTPAAIPGRNLLMT